MMATTDLDRDEKLEKMSEVRVVLPLLHLQVLLHHRNGMVRDSSYSPTATERKEVLHMFRPYPCASSSTRIQILLSTSCVAKKLKN